VTLKAVIIWITGKDLFAPKGHKTGDIVFRVYPAHLFEYAPTGDYFSLTISISSAPNALHRAMQRIAFGFKYRMIKE